MQDLLSRVAKLTTLVRQKRTAPPCLSNNNELPDVEMQDEADLNPSAEQHNSEPQSFACDVYKLDSVVFSKFSDQKGPVKNTAQKLTDFKGTSLDSFPQSMIKGDCIMARQNLYIREQISLGATKVIWSIYNLGENLRTSPTDHIG